MSRILQFGMAAIAASMFFPLGASASDIRVELARSCSDETSGQDKVTVATAESMIEVTGSQTCIDKTTRAKLTATGIRIYKNRFGSESVELVLTPESSGRWVQLQKAWLLKEFLLMGGEKSILYGRVFHDLSEPNLTLFAKDESEAKQIASTLTAGIGDTKGEAQRRRSTILFGRS